MASLWEFSLQIMIAILYRWDKSLRPGFHFRCVFIRVFISGLQPIITRDSKGSGYDNKPEDVPVSLTITIIDRFKQIKIQLGSEA